ncbi:MAG: ABC-type transport auxiliary lipoprotein family protein [Geminicoccaceae bacterium]
MRRLRPGRLGRRSLLAGALGLPLCACASLIPLPGQRAPTLYNLTPKTTFNEGLDELDVRILVEPPSAAGGLNTARIALKPDPTLLDYYADALWVEVVPIMVQTLVTESLDASGSLDVLGPDAQSLRPDYVLRLHIREFQAEYDQGLDQPPLVNVRLQARLLGMPRRQPLASFAAQQFARADGTSLDRVVLAYDEALGGVLRQIVQWVVTEIARAEGAM